MEHCNSMGPYFREQVAANETMQRIICSCNALMSRVEGNTYIGGHQKSLNLDESAYNAEDTLGLEEMVKQYMRLKFSNGPERH